MCFGPHSVAQTIWLYKEVVQQFLYIWESLIYGIFFQNQVQVSFQEEKVYQQKRGALCWQQHSH